MEKENDKNETGSAEGTEHPDVVFNGDALVVDYLTTLLTSVPAKSLDSSEINIIHLAIEAGWKLVGETGEANHTAQSFESDLSKLETETLKNENKHLKFKTELAQIDAQVLRSENKNLKAELEELKARMHGMQGAFAALAAENSELTTRLEDRNNRTDEPDTMQGEETLPPDSAGSAEQEAERASEAEEEMETEHEAVCDPCDDAPERQHEPEQPDQPVPGDTAQFEPVREAPPSPAVAADDRTHVSSSFGVAADTAYIARTHLVRESVEQKRNVVLTSRSHAAVTAPVQNVRPASKIIKHHEAGKQQARQETETAREISSPPPPQYVAAVPEAERKEETVPPVPVPETMAGPEDALAAQGELLHQDNSAEIDVEPAPAPKIVVRRNVMNYEDLQKEADSSHAPATGHTIIL